MSNNAMTHDVAARLLQVTPQVLTDLVKAGVVPRNDKNNYSIAETVHGYIKHLRSEPVRRERAPTQIEIAERLDMSDRALRELLEKLNLDHKVAGLQQITVAYIRHLREQAAGRGSESGVSLVDERARLARAQAERVEMENAVTKKELAPVMLIEQVLAQVGRQVAGVLEAIPVNLKRRSALSVEDLEYIAGEIAKARNIAAATSLDALSEDDELAEAEA
jgi:terminase small subunit / prophage DNA-packing protein